MIPPHLGQRRAPRYRTGSPTSRRKKVATDVVSGVFGRTFPRVIAMAMEPILIRSGLIFPASWRFRTRNWTFWEAENILCPKLAISSLYVRDYVPAPPLVESKVNLSPVLEIKYFRPPKKSNSEFETPRRLEKSNQT